MLIAVWAVILGMVLLAFGTAPYFFYRLGVARRSPRISPLGGDPNWLDSQPVEEILVDTWDGLTLHGYYVASQAAAPAGTVILAHGYGGDGRQLARFARIFHHRFGMNVLLPDARGYGLSEGHYIGFGWHERLDLFTWIGWVKGRTQAGAAPGNIALFGLSMGAATVLMASGEGLPPEVKVIIGDCGYTSAAEELAWQLKRQFHVPGRGLRRWLLNATSEITRKRAGYRFEEASALEQVKKSRTPTLFIHGEADTFVPFKMVKRLYAACSAEKELYTVPGAEHCRAYDTDPGEYERHLASFLKKYMFVVDVAIKIKVACG
jgi:fermentation-respiration switch protein FrsA (DUF1100 family)